MLDTGQLPLSGNALLWFRQGLAAATEDDYEQAVQHFDQVLEVRSDFYEAWFERGLALERWGYYAEAIASFDRALSLRPKNDAAQEIWHERGNALQYGLGDYTAALSCYDRVLSLSSQHELAWQNRGNALLYGFSRLEEAIYCYDQALKLNANNSLSWRNRGNALVELRRFAEAIACYDHALMVSPDDEVAWHARNRASEKSGLNYKLPTTNPAWCGTGFGESTLIEDEPQRHIDYQPSTSGMTLDAHPLLPCFGQPVLVVEDDLGQREIRLDEEQYLIGRDPKNQIQLHSQFASRHHAVLRRLSKPDGSVSYEIADGNLAGKPSTNGLIINGHKHQKRELRSDDVVVFGPRVQVTFRYSSPV